MVKQISDNEIYLLIIYIKSVLGIEAKRLSYIEDARYLKVNTKMKMLQLSDFRLISLHPTITQKKLCGYVTRESIIPFLNLTLQFTAQNSCLYKGVK